MRSHMMSVRLALILLPLAIWGCSAMSDSPTDTPMATSPMAKPKDGELALPADYKTWPKFLTDIDKEQNKQVRDIYINRTGARAKTGESFPNGTIMVMEIYKAKENPDGTLAKGADGKLVKAGLSKAFIMGRGEGWGQDVPDNVKTGNWIYSVAGPDGKLMPDDFNKCRACHVPLAQKDFVQRYDEYFQKRGGM